jgi:hypothetical protein
MRAPQFGPGKVRDRMPEGLCVRPFANVFALVEGFAVVSLHRTQADAKTALEGEIERRLLAEENNAVETPHREDGGGGE